MSDTKVVLPTLFKKTSTGAIQTWRVSVEGNRYWTDFGQQGGLIQTSEPTICIGKQGRTDDEQALAEAQALFDKKLKKDYVRTLAEAQAGGASELVEGGILPMLAHKFSEHGDKLEYPCFVQPKLDGHRCIGMPDGSLWSRTRKPITGVPHIVSTLQELDLPGALDGELYNHGYRDKFEELTHFIRQKTPAMGCGVVEYHVYDTIGEGSFRERLAELTELFSGGSAYFDVKLVETREVQNEEELMLAFEDFLAQGYEGAIARNAAGLYVNKRSYDLLKIKQFDDAEFLCVGVEEGRGKMAGHGIFVCRAEDGVEFRAKMKGEHAELKKYFEHPEAVIGRSVTVKYQGKTAYGIPRFPVALRLAASL